MKNIKKHQLLMLDMSEEKNKDSPDLGNLGIWQGPPPPRQIAFSQIA
jgi:hypothetical protein